MRWENLRDNKNSKALILKLKTTLRDLSPQANYTNRHLSAKLVPNQVLVLIWNKFKKKTPTHDR
jgi:hypothetical protein